MSDLATAPETMVASDDDAPGSVAGAVPARRLDAMAAAAAIVLVLVAVALARGTSHVRTAALYAATVAAWVVAGGVVTARRPSERQGRLILRGSLLGAVAAVAAGVLWADGDGRDLPAALVDAALLARPVALALLPAAGMHVLLTLPDGACRTGRAVVSSGYAVGGATGLLLWLQRPSLSLWLVALEAVVAGAIGLGGSNRRYRRSSGLERQRMQWFGWAVAVGAEMAVVALAARVLSG
ncbi:MAG: hypothetical protein M3O23_04375, partial [Actinomycetota bacterium]|nr:hypothetical protein [Actinomycetota bacterium]